MMIYRVVIKNKDSQIGFGYNKWEDAIEFMKTCAETVDGFEQGETTIWIHKEEEQNHELAV